MRKADRSRVADMSKDKQAQRIDGCNVTLLPYNATKFEKAVEQAIRYNPDISVLSGFKFNPNSSNLSLILAWEYGLSQVSIDDLQERIRQGMLFHRYCGTPYALRLALSWYDFDDIKIEEEEPGEHFAEFQIGLNEIPNDLDVEKMVQVAAMSAPLRSRLSRMYNDLYDIRRFVLDESPWGDLLSDHSGYQLTEDGPKFSFGRINNFDLEIPTPQNASHTDRDRYAFAMSMDTYRLDWAILDETDVGMLNHDMSREAHRYIFNTDFAGDKMGNIFRTRTLAKALCVLSEDAVLEDINTCFSCGTVAYEEDPFELSFNYLSEVKLGSTPVLIAYRDYREEFREATSDFDVDVERGHRARERCSMCNLSADVDQIQTMERSLTVQYKGNNTWHDQRHFDVSWKDQANYLGRMR